MFVKISDGYLNLNAIALARREEGKLLVYFDRLEITLEGEEADRIDRLLSDQADTHKRDFPVEIDA